MQMTSIESYRKLKDDGVLADRMWQALDYITSRGRCVARDIPMAGWKRCADLERMGLIKRDGTMYDVSTGREVQAWAPTGIEAGKVQKLPKPLKSEDKVTDEMLDEVEKRIEVLGQVVKAQEEVIKKLTADGEMLLRELFKKEQELQGLREKKASGIITL